jgi:ABC transporter, ATP-binding protein
MFLKIEQTQYGFTGVTNQVEQVRKAFPDAIFERATVEDVMLTHIKEGENI